MSKYTVQIGKEYMENNTHIYLPYNGSIQYLFSITNKQSVWGDKHYIDSQLKTLVKIKTSV